MPTHNATFIGPDCSFDWLILLQGFIFMLLTNFQTQEETYLKKLFLVTLHTLLECNNLNLPTNVRFIRNIMQ